MHDINSFYNFELATYERVTDLERLGMENQLMPDMRDARFLGQPEDWPEVRRKLVDFLASNIGSANYVGLGRRYIAYEVAGVLMKFLYKKKESDLLVDGQRVRQTNSRDTIMTAHQQEHAVVRRHFMDSVPDTLFVATPFPVGGLNSCDEVKKLTEDRVHLMIQECVFNAISIYAATQDARGEQASFKTGLEGFLSSYYTMRSEEGFIPEIPSLRGENVLVGSDGRIWVVDTNNLIKTHTRDGIVTSRYADRFKFDPMAKSDSIIREIESMIRALEKGHVPGNPQG